MKYTERVIVRLTKQQKKYFEEIAAAQKITVSDLLRKLIIEAIEDDDEL